MQGWLDQGLVLVVDEGYEGREEVQDLAIRFGGAGVLIQGQGFGD